MKVCLNCVHYDARVAQQCRDKRAEPVFDKNLANYCEWFEMAKRVWGGATKNNREDAARETLKKLLG